MLDKYTADLTQDEIPEEEPVEVAPDNPPNPDVPEDSTVPMDPPPTNDTPAPPAENKLETPPIIDSRYWYGDENTSQMIKNVGRWNETTREGQKYHMGVMSDHLASVKDRYSLGDPNDIMGNLLDYLGGQSQMARDRATINETKLFGDMDNYVPPNMPTERHDDSVPEPDLKGITEDTLDRYLQRSGSNAIIHAA